MRRTIQLQFNKSEYRHKLPRLMFFAGQDEFSAGECEEIMNKANCFEAE